MSATDNLFSICQIIFVASNLRVVFSRKARMPRHLVLLFCFGYALLTMTAFDAGLWLGGTMTTIGFFVNAFIACYRTEPGT